MLFRSGFVLTLANAIPTYQMAKDMDGRGIFLNTAWSISAMAMLGDHLGFTAGVQPEMILPVIIGKLVAALSAVVLAYLIARKRYPAYQEPEKEVAEALNKVNQEEK